MNDFKQEGERRLLWRLDRITRKQLSCFPTDLNHDMNIMTSMPTHKDEKNSLRLLNAMAYRTERKRCLRALLAIIEEMDGCQ